MIWTDQRIEQRTEADAGILLTNILTLFIGEEHVGRETALRSVGIWTVSELRGSWVRCVDVPFFFFSVPRLLALVEDFALALGILVVVRDLVTLEEVLALVVGLLVACAVLGLAIIEE